MLPARTLIDTGPIVALLSAGDELVLVRVADGTWLEPPAPADGWGQLRGVAATSDRIYAVGLAGAFWSASDPSGEWTAMAGGIADDLLDVGTYGDYWANKWADLLRPNPDRVGVKSVYTLDQWLREAFRANKPYDQFVAELILVQCVFTAKTPFSCPLIQ